MASSQLRRIDIVQQIEVLQQRPPDAAVNEQIATLERMLADEDREDAIDQNLVGPGASRSVGAEDEKRGGHEMPDEPVDR